MNSILNINKLCVGIEGKKILNGISLTVKPGEIHAVMGPNGSGKSTLAFSLMGYPAYKILSGTVTFNGHDLLALSPDQRAQLGLFMAFQYPVEVPGVKVQNFLREAHQARFRSEQKKQFKRALDFRTHLAQLAVILGVKPELLTRGLNEGFSGGEKKRLEVLQMAVMAPKFAILDETDSGLDIDAIKAVASGITKNITLYKTGVLLITHYQRILDYLTPDFVHVMVDGKIVISGDKTLVKQLELKGYKNWQKLIGMKKNKHL